MSEPSLPQIRRQVIPDRYIDRQRLEEKLRALFPPPAEPVRAQVRNQNAFSYIILIVSLVEIESMDYNWGPERSRRSMHSLNCLVDFKF